MRPLVHTPYFWWLVGATVLMAIIFTILKNIRMPRSLSGFRPGGQRVSFAFSGRDGEAYYSAPEGSFRMYLEFGGGNVVVIISVPTPQNWVAETGIPLERRESVLRFIGQEAITTQNAGRGSFGIGDDAILIYGQ